MTVTRDRQQEVEDQLVRTVLESFDGTPDPRLKQVTQALVRHLHAFLREVRLTEAEWQHAIDFLTAAGHITTGNRQEFILLSDVLGASMQTIWRVSGSWHSEKASFSQRDHMVSSPAR